MFRRSAIMDRNMTTSAGSAGDSMALISAMAASMRSLKAITSSGNWIAASGVSASQEIEGSKRRISVGRCTDLGALVPAKRVVPPGAFTVGTVFGMESIGFFPSVQQPSAKRGTVVDIAVAVAAAAFDENTSETVGVDARCMLSSESAVRRGGNPVLRRHTPGRTPFIPFRLSAHRWALTAGLRAARESSDSWILVFLFRLCDMVTGDTVVCISVPVGSLSRRRALNDLGVPYQRIQAGGPASSRRLPLRTGDQTGGFQAVQHSDDPRA
jgi:hypothetical protein